MLDAITPDYAAIKTRQQAMWGSGNYAVVGTTLQIMGERLCEAVDLRAGERVLDVAAGNGNATLAAARHFAEVTSTDYVASLLDQGKARAAAEGLAVAFQQADAEALPFADASFDVALSTVGVMFAPHQEKAAAEMSRVIRKGGRIGLASWTPEGFIGQLFKIIGRPMCRRPPASNRPRCGEWRAALWSCSRTTRSRPASRSSAFATNQRRIGWRYSKPGTAPPTAPSRPLTLKCR